MKHGADIAGIYPKKTSGKAQIHIQGKINFTTLFVTEERERKEKNVGKVQIQPLQPGAGSDKSTYRV